MTFKISSAVDKIAGDKPVRLVKENPNRTVLNIDAGEYDLWFGDENVRAGTVGNKVAANKRLELKIRGEVWVIRLPGQAAMCGHSQETERG